MRIVLTTHGTLGDLHPYLAIALELQRRGHRPVIATSEYHRRKVEAAGVELHAIRPDISFEDRELHRLLTEPRRGMERVIRELMMPVLRATYDDLLPVVASADVLVSQILIFAAPLLAEKTGVRWISTELQPGAFTSAYDPPVLSALPSLARLRGLGAPFHRAFFRVARLIGHLWSEPVRALRRELGLPPGKDPLFEGRHSPEGVLALFSSIIGPPQPDWPANTLVTGFPFYDEAPVSLAIDDAPIVFTLGSSAVWDPGNFYEESIAAAKKLGRPALFLTGPNRLAEGVRAIPYAPYASIFPHASAIVHQGGIGTTAQALRAGKPMLVMPFGGDQYDNAARVERLGAGRTILRKHYSADRAAAALQKVFDCAEQASSIGEAMQAEHGVRSACEAITAASSCTR